MRTGARPRSFVALSSLALLVTAACDSPPEPTLGDLRVSVTTTGGDLDLDGYGVSVNRGTEQRIPVNASLVVAGVAEGRYTVELRGVADNCAVTGEALRDVTISAGDTTTVAFDVTCLATAFDVTTATGGLDLDADGYTLSLDGALPVPIGPNASVTFGRLAPGPHTLTLEGLADNCEAPGTHPATVEARAGEVVPVALSVTCRATTGVVEVNAATSGLDLDSDGYTVQLDGGAPILLALNGTVRIGAVSGGDHAVTLAGAAGNCPAAGSNPRTVTVTTGGLTRDTVRTTFQVTCTAVTGVIEVTAATSGTDLDPDGYSIQLDAGAPQTVGLNGVVRFASVAAGNHQLTLAGAAGNCPVAADNPRTVSVTTGGITRDTARTTFAVACGAVSAVIEVTTATVGIDLDANGYTVQLDAGAPQAVGLSGLVRFTGVGAGDHQVTLAGAADNCPVAADNPRTVAVTTGGATRDTARTTFNVTCGALTGVIEVTTTTVGVELDPDGYTIQLDGGPTQALGGNATFRFAGVSGGEHQLTLAGMAGNCPVEGVNPRPVSVVTGGVTRDTARITFAVTCAATTGALRITATTTGAQYHAASYDVGLDEYCYDYYGYYYCYYTWSGSVGANGSVIIPDLTVGEHTVVLGGWTFNCNVSQNSFLVTIPPGDTVDVAFPVTCVEPGRVEVTVTTTGADPDPNGYAVVVRGSEIGSIPVNGTLTSQLLLPGSAEVSLQGVAGNCTVGAPNPRTITVPAGGTAAVAFDVTCVALGAIQVTTTTTGADLDPDGYTIAVSGVSPGTGASVPSNGTVTFPGLVPGDYTVLLMGVAPNCTVGGSNPRPVTVASGATAAVAFDVTCTALGSLQITTTTTGVDLDPNGYAANTNSGAGTGVPANGTATLSGLLPGDYVVTLSGVAMNCNMASPNPVTVTVPSGGTASAGFDITCAAATMLAVVSNGDIYSIKSNGANLTQLTTHPASDADPAWSPGGAKIAFTSYRDGTAQVYVMDANGANQTRLTSAAGASYNPTWSPDGSKIAFVSDRTGNAEIFVMDATGANQVNVTNHPAWDTSPVWSVNGTIAFASQRDASTLQIWVMGSDGSNATRLTNSGVDDSQPDWSPDGTKLAIARTTCYADYYYYCVSALVVLNANGSGETLLSTGSSAADPAWSPDGQWIAFTSLDYNAVYLTRVDGTRAVDLTANAWQPAWRW